MEKPILLLFTSWFDNGDIGPFYCPDSRIVEGSLAFNPDIYDNSVLGSIEK